MKLQAEYNNISISNRIKKIFYSKDSSKIDELVGWSDGQNDGLLVADVVV